MYKYSELSEDRQLFVPALLNTLKSDARDLAVGNFPFIFQNFYESDKKTLKPRPNEIDTGDGGFIFFDTPIHAICYLIAFSALLRLYNAHMFLPELRGHLGSIEIRFAITHDNVYKYQNRFYGSGIINNARMLSRDKLNRFLVEKNVVDWFLGTLIGIERLEIVSLEEIAEIPEFLDYDRNWMSERRNSVIVSKGVATTEGIRSVDLLKIGKIKEKATEIEIYNLALKVVSELESPVLELKQTFALSIGNINSEGLSET